MEAVTQPSDPAVGATIYQVARQAGVSVATVSRLLNGSGYVSARSRAAIQAAVDELKYEPNALARSLTTKKTGMLALLLTDLTNPFSAQIARGVQDSAQAAGYVSIICSIDDSPLSELETIRLLRRKRVDGIILTPVREEAPGAMAELLRVLGDRGTGVVCIGRRLDGVHGDEVSVDTVAGAREAVVHLASLGHRRIGYIGGLASKGIAVGRLRGYRAGLADAGLPLDNVLVREGELDEESGRREALALLALSQRPTALFCVNDRTAFGALAAAREAGYWVPGDLSVVGFDDVPLAQLIDPSLTTVRQPARELGRLAGAFLLERIADPARPHQRRVLPCELIGRRSSAPPGGAALLAPQLPVTGTVMGA